MLYYKYNNLHSQVKSAIDIALQQAKIAGRFGFVPVGAVILDANDEIIATGQNGQFSTEHAELQAINKAGKLNGRVQDKLRKCTLITTLEPCIMCAGAILNAQIDRVLYLARDEKFGAAGSVWDLLRDPLASHHAEIVQIDCEQSSEYSEMLTNWFIKLRNSTKISSAKKVCD